MTTAGRERFRAGEIDTPLSLWYSRRVRDRTQSFLRRLREDTARGLLLLRQSGSVLADRAVLEANVLKERYRLSGLDRRIEESYRLLGEKVFDRLQRGEEKLLSDEEASLFFQQIDQALKEREKLAADIEALKKTASEKSDKGL